MSTLDIHIPVGGVTVRSLTEPAPLRIVLYRGETLRVPRAIAGVQVLSGTAWLTVPGKDSVLCAGERLDLCNCRGSAVLSAVGGEPLLIQLR